MTKIIDWTQPVCVAGRDLRKAFVKRVFNNGSALVAIDKRDDVNPIIYDAEGKFVGNPDPRFGEHSGSGLTIMNMPAPTFFVEMTATEIATVRCLLGRCTGGATYQLFSDLERVAEGLSLDTVKEFFPETINTKSDSPGFKRVVEAYKEVLKFHAEPFKVERS